MPVVEELKGSGAPVKIWTDDIDYKTRQQLYNISHSPVVGHHVAVMPDVHLGKGATIGSVIPTSQAIIPAAVGVDIGCGMNAVCLDLVANDLPDNLKQLRNGIEEAVPVGYSSHALDKVYYDKVRHLQSGYDSILEKSPALQKKNSPKWIQQAGTLGGGNHFIEICLDEQDRVWIMLHSGSRHIGNRIGMYFIEEAKYYVRKIDQNLPDMDLAWLEEGNPQFDKYVEALGWAQDYAAQNRRIMMDLVHHEVDKHIRKSAILGEAINCHHNYVQKEKHFGQEYWITRKGAIDASEGKMGIIPGSMGAKSYIVRGKGNEESFHSCAHGAGRRMSRNKAREKYSASDLVEQTSGVECHKGKSVLDEIPAAYKDIDVVMEHQTDLVDISYTLKQVVCVKG